MDVKTFCLAVLSRDDATGYAIKKACEEGCFSHFYAAGFGSIYPALNALCSDGLVTVRPEMQDGRPGRKVYRLTGSGRMALAEALLAPPTPDRVRSDFMLVAFFAHLVPPRRIDELIAARIADLKARLAEFETHDGDELPPGEAFTLGYGCAIHRAEIAYLEEQRHVLVGRLIRGTSRDTDTRPQSAAAE